MDQKVLMPEISVVTVLFLVIVSLSAGMIDAISGGGGLLALPALLSLNITPAQAIATNKLQSLFGSVSASVFFVTKRKVKIKEIKEIIFISFIGGILGSFIVQILDSSFLSYIVPFFLILGSVYLCFSPKVGDEDTKNRLSQATFAISVAPAIAFYDGFFGPGSVSLLTISFASLLGFGLVKATAYTKVVNLASSSASVFLFILGGKPIWVLSIIMAFGQVIGSYIGSTLVIKYKAKLVKPFLIISSLTMTLILILKNL